MRNTELNKELSTILYVTVNCVIQTAGMNNEPYALDDISVIGIKCGINGLNVSIIF